MCCQPKQLILARSGSHDVGLVDGSNALTAVRLGIVERVSRNAFGGIPSDELNGLDDTVNNLVLDTGVLSLSVLTYENGVNVVVGSLEALDGDTWPDIGEEVESPTECQVEGDMALADCGERVRRGKVRSRANLNSLGVARGPAYHTR